MQSSRIITVEENKTATIFFPEYQKVQPSTYIASQSRRPLIKTKAAP